MRLHCIAITLLTINFVMQAGERSGIKETKGVLSLKEYCSRAIGRYYQKDGTRQRLLGKQYKSDTPVAEQIISRLPTDVTLSLLPQLMHVKRAYHLFDMEEMVNGLSVLYKTRQCGAHSCKLTFCENTKPVTVLDCVSDMPLKLHLTGDKKHIVIRWFNGNIDVRDIQNGTRVIRIMDATDDYYRNTVYAGYAQKVFYINNLRNLNSYDIGTGKTELIVHDVDSIYTQLPSSRALVVLNKSSYGSKDHLRVRAINENGTLKNTFLFSFNQRFNTHSQTISLVADGHDIMVMDSGYNNKKYTKNGIAEMWDMSTRQPEVVALLDHPLYDGPIESLCSMTNSSQVATGTDWRDHAVYIWSIADIKKPTLLSRYALTQPSPLTHLWFYDKKLYIKDGHSFVHTMDLTMWNAAIQHLQQQEAIGKKSIHTIKTTE
ncbi:MAG: hypothetical protein WCE21_02530 [Candidatus Babeliales bacterium]